MFLFWVHAIAFKAKRISPTSSEKNSGDIIDIDRPIHLSIHLSIWDVSHMRQNANHWGTQWRLYGSSLYYSCKFSLSFVWVSIMKEYMCSVITHQRRYNVLIIGKFRPRDCLRLGAGALLHLPWGLRNGGGDLSRKGPLWGRGGVGLFYFCFFFQNPLLRYNLHPQTSRI